MRLKIKAGCGIRKILGAGYGMNFPGETGMLVFSQVGCGIFKELIAGCGMEHVKKDLQKRP